MELRNLISILIIPVLCWACNSRATFSDNNTTTKTSTNNDPKNSSLSLIKLPPGFHITYFSEKVPGARSLAIGAHGTIFVGTRDKTVYALTDENHDGVADKVYIIADHLHSPNGVAFKNGNLYVAEISKIWRFDDIEAHLSDPPKPVLVTDNFPADEWHGWKYIAFGPDGKLYVPVGSPCNVCKVDENKYANLNRINADGTGKEVYAKGIRNTVGFDWNPLTKELWFTDNGRDEMGDDIPADELNHAPRPGMHFGFPFCQQGDIPDPVYGKGHDCKNYTPPAQKLGAHVAALGMKFYTATRFPAEYQNQIFIAEHGSWNRSSKVGYRVTLVKLKGDKAVSYEPFATGWLQGEKPWGRTVDLLGMPDGSMLVSDDFAGCIYRISYEGK
jgi:glucose/arabinose dehydrogenase